MLTVEPDNEKFGVWLEAKDGSRTYLDTKAIHSLMFDLDMAWYGFIAKGFDGVVESD